MDNKDKNDGELGNETWGAERWKADSRASRDGTGVSSEEGSEFSPAELEMMRRNISELRAPLPQGVQEIEWQAPRCSGLQHSSPIFETEHHARGVLGLTSRTFTSNNCHFRSWQEDNGVAETFATETAEKVVDGCRMTVAVCRSSTIQPTSSVPVSSGASEDIGCLRALRRSSSEGNDSRIDRSELETGAPRPSPLPSTDASDQNMPSMPRRPSEDTAVARVLERTSDCAHDKTSDGNLPVDGVTASLSLPSTDALNPKVSSMPHRPQDGVASSLARQPRPGRSLSSKVYHVCVGATVQLFVSFGSHSLTVS